MLTVIDVHHIVWIMLMHSRIQLGETVKANGALASARTALANDSNDLRAVNAAAQELDIPNR